MDTAQGMRDFEALARQYWGMWGDAVRGAIPQPGADAGVQGFRDALGAWTNLAGDGRSSIDNVLGHFNRQSGDWFAQMQQVAAQFAGREHSAQDVTRAWLQMLGGNPFQGLMHGMRGPGYKIKAEFNEHHHDRGEPAPRHRRQSRRRAEARHAGGSHPRAWHPAGAGGAGDRGAADRQ